ncbi:MAG: hypothetical protein IPN01_17895 [Deltaproteobacteria bacterium]|nr:hypothetical protein [Deltaproteobacteria bacterium]
MRQILFALALGGCNDAAPEDSEAPDWAWDDAPPVALTLRPMLSREIDGASGITRLRHDPATALTFAIDPAAGRVHVLDEVYAHDARPTCVEVEDIHEEDVPEWRGGCAEGEVELRRGVWALSGVIDVAIDPDTLTAWIVSERGFVAQSPMALGEGTTLGWLRLSDAISTSLTITSAAWSDGLWVTTPTELVRLEGGEVTQRESLADATILSGDGGLFLWSPAGLHLPGVAEAVPATLAAAAGGRAVWWQDGVLTWSDGATLALDETPLALAVDPRSGVVTARTADALLRLSPEGETARVELPPATETPETLLVTPTHDVLLAGGDVLSVHSDELSLIDDSRPPLQLIPIGFLENPKNYNDPIYCDGPSLEDALGHRLRTARENQALVAGLPGGVAVAVTPRFAEAVLHCDQADAIQFWAADPVGVLLHQVSECPDQTCFDDMVKQRIGRLRAVGFTPAWVAGSTADDTVGLDLLKPLLAEGLTHQLFFATGLDPTIPFEHPLFKQPWPLRPGDGPGATTLDHLDEWPGDPDGDGAMTLYSGNTLRGFSLGACAGLLAQECIVLGAGEAVFDEDDALAIALYARHAAARREPWVSTFTWHLPDLGTYTYTQGCVSQGDGTWEKLADDATCEAEVLTRIHWDLQQVLVENGVAEWARPEGLGGI